MPLVTQEQMDLALLAFIGAVALGCALVGLEWLVKRIALWGREDILPPPDQAAERRAYSWKEDTE